MSANAGDEKRLVAGVDVAVAMLFREALGGAARVVVALALEDHLGAEVLHGFDLDRVGGGRRADDGADAEQPRRESDGLPVVAGRGGDNAAAALVLGQPADQVDSAAHLEGAGRVQVLVLDVRLGAEHAVERRVAPQRRRRDVLLDLAGRVEHVGERRLG